MLLLLCGGGGGVGVCTRGCVWWWLLCGGGGGGGREERGRYYRIILNHHACDTITNRTPNDAYVHHARTATAWYRGVWTASWVRLKSVARRCSVRGCEASTAMTRRMEAALLSDPHRRPHRLTLSLSVSRRGHCRGARAMDGVDQKISFLISISSSNQYFVSLIFHTVFYADHDCL